MNARALLFGFVVALSSITSLSAKAEDRVFERRSGMSWSEAAELLQRERLAAELCVRLVKLYLPRRDIAARKSAEMAYEAGRVEMNAAIVGLQVGLTNRSEEKILLQTVERKTEAGTKARREFCTKAEALVPVAEEGEKGLVAEILSGTVGEVIAAAVSIWERLREDDDLRRASIRTALEDAKWQPFTEIQL